MRRRKLSGPLCSLGEQGAQASSLTSGHWARVPEPCAPYGDKAHSVFLQPRQQALGIGMSKPKRSLIPGFCLGGITERLPQAKLGNKTWIKAHPHAQGPQRISRHCCLFIKKPGAHDVASGYELISPAYKHAGIYWGWASRWRRVRAARYRHSSGLRVIDRRLRREGGRGRSGRRGLNDRGWLWRRGCFCSASSN